MLLGLAVVGEPDALAALPSDVPQAETAPRFKAGEEEADDVGGLVAFAPALLFMRIAVPFVVFEDVAGRWEMMALAVLGRMRADMCACLCVRKRVCKCVFCCCCCRCWR